MGYVFNVFTSNFDAVDQGGSFWGSPVADYATLSAITTDVDGTVRVTLDTNDAYRWNLATTTWEFVGLVKDAPVGASPNGSGYSIDTDNVLTLQPADSTNPGVVTIAAQSFAGNKTFDDEVVVTGVLTANNTINAEAEIESSTSIDIGPAIATSVNIGRAAGQINLSAPVAASQDITATGVIYADGSLDVTATAGSDVLSIGAVNADVVNIGNPASTVNIQGTVNNIETTNLNVTDSLITINDGGAVGSGAGAGIEVEENAVATGHIKVSGDRNSWLLKAPNAAGDVTLTPGASGITIDQSSHNPVTVSDSDTIDLTLSTQQISAVVRFADTTVDSNASGIKVGNDSLTNTHINSSAGIVYSKLSLTDGIVNADINSTAAIAVSKLAALTASRAIVSDGSGVLTVSDTTSTQIGYLSNVTSDVQTQLDSKPNKSAGDINETSFIAANNQVAAADVTGLVFANATVRSAEVLLSVVVDATSDLYESFKLQLIQKGASWSMSSTSVGDVSGFTFSVTNAGQVQYTNSNYAGFVSATVKFRAITTSV